MRKTLIHLILFIFLLSTTGLLAQKQTFTAELLWQMKRVTSLEVSTDGQKAVYTLGSFDIEGDKSFTDLYLLDLSTGRERRLTFTGRESSPVFSPDGRYIAFISRRNEGTAQLYVMPMEGGEAEKITDLPVGIYSPKWFPDGKRIAFGANVLPDYDGDFQKLAALIDARKKSKVTARTTENVMYRYWDRWLTEGYFSRLFAVDLQSKKVTDLMPGLNNYFNMMGGVSYDISPDGKQIALSMNTTQPPFERLNYDIFLLDADGSGRMLNLTAENEADDVSPVFSPDGKKILYGRQQIGHFYADRVEMIVYEAETKNSQNISGSIDLSMNNWLWSRDGKIIYFDAEYQAMNAIFSIPSTGGKHQLIYGQGTNSNLRLVNAQTLIFTHHNLNKPADIYSISIQGKGLKQLTDVNAALLSSLDFGQVENVTYKGANDADVQMFIVYPPGFDPTKKYPLVVMIHGGPHGTFGDFWHYRWNAHLFAAPGYVAILPNFHGSTSFGQDFAISIHGEHAPKPFNDIMKATDYMIERGFIDEKRMAAAGGSYGGYMVSWIAGHTDRYAALVNHAGVYDLHLQFASDYAGNRAHQYGGTPWQDFDKLNANNPSQFAANFSSPMLVIHGELDYRVPVAHAFLVYGIYKGKGLDARLVYYPDENHWILRPQNSIFWYKEVHNWFERYLKSN